MDDRQINYIIKNGKWNYSVTDYLDRHFLLSMPLVFIGLGIYMLFQDNKFRQIKFSSFTSLLPYFLLIAGCLFAILFYKRVESERSFRKIEILKKINIGDLTSSLSGLGWSIEELEGKYIIAQTDWSAFSWGEEVTIILCTDYLLINSRTTGSQPFTLGRDIHNYKMLKEHLELKLLA